MLFIPFTRRVVKNDRKEVLHGIIAIGRGAVAEFSSSDYNDELARKMEADLTGHLMAQFNWRQAAKADYHAIGIEISAAEIPKYKVGSV